MLRTTLLNGITTEKDKDYTALGLAILGEGIIEGLQVTTNQVATGSAFIKATRTSTTPNEEVLVKFEITANEVIDTSGTKKVWIEILQDNINDAGLNDANGTIAWEIKTGASYPSTNFIALADIVSGVITDDRSFIKLKLKRDTLTPNKLFYTDSNGIETELSFWALGEVLSGLGTTTPPAWQVPSSGDVTGVVKNYAGATAPDGYFLCDGGAVSRTTYADLFTVVGTTFGAWDGSTTFNVPNLKGKVPVWVDTGQTEFDTIGESGGAKTHTLSTGEIPAHTHNADLYDEYNASNWSTRMTAAGTTFRTSNVAMGGSIWGSGSHNNLQPYMALHYIIKY